MREAYSRVFYFLIPDPPQPAAIRFPPTTALPFQTVLVTGMGALILFDFATVFKPPSPFVSVSSRVWQ